MFELWYLFSDWQQCNVNCVITYYRVRHWRASDAIALSWRHLGQKHLYFYPGTYQLEAGFSYEEGLLSHLYCISVCCENIAASFFCGVWWGTVFWAHGGITIFRVKWNGENYRMCVYLCVYLCMTWVWVSFLDTVCLCPRPNLSAQLSSFKWIFTFLFSLSMYISFIFA